MSRENQASAAPPFVRKRLFVDEIQRRIIVKTILQWYFYMSAILLVVCLGSAWLNPHTLAIKHVFSAFVYFSPGVIASIILLPLVIYDMLVSTNKVAGPIYRLRKEMRTVIDGEEVNQLKFREGDAFQELAEDFNELVAYVNQLKQSASSEPSNATKEDYEPEVQAV